MSKFKVGDRVMVIGTISGTVIDVNSRGVVVECDEPNKGVEIRQYPNKMVLWPNESQVELIAPNRYELHITCNDGKTTNAVYKVNGKIEKRAEAVCAPSDTFDFATGAQTAFDRVFPKALTQPVAPQEDKAKEPIKLYCVKDVSSNRRLSKGEIYEVNGDGRITYNDGSQSSCKYDSCEWHEEIKNISGNLFPLVKRPAKVGEYVLITKASHFSTNKYKNGDIIQVKKELSFDGCFAFGDCGTWEQVAPKEYEVLDGYKPEEKVEEYYNGKVVCVDRGGSRSFTQYKGYEFKNGIVIDDDGDEYNSPCKTLHDFNNSALPQFIPYLGE